MRAGEERVTLNVEVLRVTDRAILVSTDDADDDIWIPKSQIDEDASEVKLEEGESGVLAISQWIAEQKGLV